MRRGTDFDLERSDADFLVEFDATESSPPLKTFFALRDDLAAIVGRRVDLVMADSLTNPYMKAEVARSREQIYAA